MLAQRPTVSLKEARKILGKDAEGLSDVMLLDVINTLTLLAREHFSQAGSNRKPNTIQFERSKDDNDGTKE
jgi:hypothetical protein